MRIHILRGTFAAAALGAVVAVGSGTAVGADPAPAPCEGKLAFKDPAKDQANSIYAPTADQTESTDIVGGFLLHDPAKAAEATSLNIVIKDLKAQVPSGYVSLAWFGNYKVGGKQYFLRSILDFTGANVYEWGEFTPNPAGVVLTGVSVYKGTTKGALFEGPNGVVQIVVPAEAGGAASSQMTNIYTQSGQTRTSLPTAFPPTVSRGTTGILDTAPDVGTESKVSYTPTACTPVSPITSAAPIPDTTTVATEQPTGTSEVPENGGVAKLPVKVAAAKAPKKKVLSLKLRTTEPITDIGARLRKGSKTLGSGKLADLSDSGRLKLKLAKKVKKGQYLLDLAGTLADGRRAVATLKVKLK